MNPETCVVSMNVKSQDKINNIHTNPLSLYSSSVLVTLSHCRRLISTSLPSLDPDLALSTLILAGSRPRYARLRALDRNKLLTNLH